LTSLPNLSRYPRLYSVFSIVNLPTPSYVLAPTLDTPDGPIALGNIIRDPKVPDERDNGREPAAIPNISQAFKYNYHVDATTSGRQSGAFLASFLSTLGIGGDITSRHSSSNSHSFSFSFSVKVLETRKFNPSSDYIEAALHDPNVVTYIMSGTLRRRPMYMITGIMVARGASAVIQHLQERRIYVQVGVNANAAGLPLEVEPKVDVSSDSKKSVAFDDSCDFVLAYRLRKIVVSRKDDVTSKHYTKGAFLNTKEEIFEARVAGVQIDEVCDEMQTIRDLRDCRRIYDDDGEEEIGCAVLA